QRREGPRWSTGALRRAAGAREGRGARLVARLDREHLAQLRQVGAYVDLDGGALGAAVALLDAVEVGGDLPAHLRRGGQGDLALDDAGDPLRLGLHEPGDRADGPDQSDEVQAGARGDDDALVQPDGAVSGQGAAAGQEGEVQAEAGAVDDGVHRLGGTVGEDDPVAVEGGDRGPGCDGAVADAAEDLVRERHGGGEDAVGRLGQGVVRERAAGDEQGLLDEAALLLGGRVVPPGGVGDLVEREAEQLRGHDVQSAPYRQHRAGGVPGEVGGDVHRGRAQADHDDALPGEVAAVAVVQGVKNRSGEVLGAGRERGRQRGQGVVAGGHDHVVEPSHGVGALGAGDDRPGAAGVAAHGDGLGAQFDAVPDTGPVGEGAQVGGDVAVPGVERVLVRHREAVVTRQFLGRVEV